MVNYNQSGDEQSQNIQRLLQQSIHYIDIIDTMVLINTINSVYSDWNFIKLYQHVTPGHLSNDHVCNLTMVKWFEKTRSFTMFLQKIRPLSIIHPVSYSPLSKVLKKTLLSTRDIILHSFVLIKGEMQLYCLEMVKLGLLYHLRTYLTFQFTCLMKLWITEN